MKRPYDHVDEPSNPVKRARIESQPILQAKYRQPGDLLLPANPQDPTILERLIKRTCAIALRCAGFDSVNIDALESISNQLRLFLSHVTQFTHRAVVSSRRRRLIPHDIQFALRQTGITIESLLPNIKPAAQKRPPSFKVVRRTLQPPLFLQSPSSSTARDFDFSAATTLWKSSGANTDEASQRFIPRKFPVFPPPHTFRATEVPRLQREADARKIRERATQEGVLAERALRKLLQARKGTSRRGSRQGDGSKDDAIFKEAMVALLKEDYERGRESLQEEDELLFLDESEKQTKKEAEERRKQERAEAENEDFSFGPVVNHDRAHWRSGARGLFS